MLETKIENAPVREGELTEARGAKPASEFPVKYELVESERSKLGEATQICCSICDDLHAYANCSACTGVRRGQCKDDLMGLLGDLLSYVLENFEQEECLMRESLLVVFERESCDAHKEDHAAISGKIKWIISSLGGTDTVSLSRQLELLLNYWADEHVARYDLPLARWVNRQRGAYFKRRT